MCTWFVSTHYKACAKVNQPLKRVYCCSLIVATFGVLWCMFEIHFEIHTATEYIFICLFHKWSGDREEEVSNDIVHAKSLELEVNR